MTSGQALNFCQRIIDLLCVEAPATLEECVLVAKVAVLWTASRDHNRVRYKVVGAVNQVAADRRNALQRASSRGNVDVLWLARAKVLQKLRKRLFTGTEKDRVSMSRRLFGKGSDVQSSQADKCSPLAIVVGDPVCAICVGDVNLYDNEVWCIVKRERFDVFINDDGAIVRRKISRKSSEPQGREQ